MFNGKAFRGGKYDGTTAHSSNVFIPLRASSARLHFMPTLRVARFPRLPFFTTPSQSTRRRVVTGNFQREAKTFIVVNIIFSSLCHLADSCETTSKAPLSELLCNRRNGRKTKNIPQTQSKSSGDEGEKNCSATEHAHFIIEQASAPDGY